MSDLKVDKNVAKKVNSCVYQLLSPLYCCGGDGSGIIITGGGGGSKQFGVSNMLQLHIITDSCSKLTTVSTLDMGEQIAKSLNYSDQHKLWTATMDDSVLLFDIDEAGLFAFRPLVKFSAEIKNNGVCRFAKLTNFKGQRLILTGGGESEARVWNFPLGQPPTLFLSVTHGSGKDSDLVDGSWDIDGSRFLSASRIGQIKIWETASGACIASVNPPVPDLFIRMCNYLEDGSILAAYYTAPRGPSFLQKLDGNGKFVGEIIKLRQKSVVSSLHLSNETAAIGFNTGQVEHWDLKRMRKLSLKDCGDHDLAVGGAIVVPGGVASVSVDFTVRLWPSSKSSFSLMWFVFLMLSIAGILLTAPLATLIQNN